MTERWPSDWSDMRALCARLLEERTGFGITDWNRRVAGSGARDERELRQWLDEHGVTGYPQLLLVMERFGYPDQRTAKNPDPAAGAARDEHGGRSGKGPGPGVRPEPGGQPEPGRRPESGR